jgi:hypothetical protein
MGDMARVDDLDPVSAAICLQHGAGMAGRLCGGGDCEEGESARGAGEESFHHPRAFGSDAVRP